jgi:tetratricopeptide (TPR) repeat protein
MSDQVAINQSSKDAEPVETMRRDESPLDRPVFISYSSKDEPVAEMVRAALETEDIGCWIAPRDIPPGGVWADAIVGALDAAKLVVVIFSAHANQSEQVAREVKTAVDRSLPIVNFWIDKAIPSGAMDYFLGITHWLSAAEPGTQAHLPRLVRTVRVLLGLDEPGPDWPGIGYTWFSAQRDFLNTIPHWTGAATPLVDVAGNLQELSAVWGRANQGSLQTALVLGEPGVGKSRLVQEFLAQQRLANVTMLPAQASIDTRDIPFQPVVQLLRPLIVQRKLPHMSAELMAEIAQLTPGMRGAIPGLPVAPKVEADTALQRQTRALVTFFVTLCQERPLILAIDDLQWADPATFGFLTELLFHTLEATNLPLLVIGTLRPLDEPVPCQVLRSRLSRQRNDTYTEILIRPLERHEVSQVIEHRLNRAAAWRLTDPLYKHTKGNPLFLLEMISALMEKGGWASLSADASLPFPTSIQALIVERVQALGAPSRSCLETAVVIDGAFDQALLQQATGLSAAQVTGAVQDLIARGFVRRNEASFELSHDLTREAVLPTLTDARDYHRRVGEAIEATSQAALRPAVVQQLAQHFFAAEIWDKALRYNIQAGLDSVSLFDIPTARRLLERAQQSAEKPAVHVTRQDKAAYLQGLGDVYHAANEREQAIACYESALAVIAQGDRVAPLPLRPGDRLPPDCRKCAAADLARRIGRLHGWQGNLEEALAWMAAGRAWIAQPQDQAESDALALIETHTASLLFQQGQFEKAEARCRTALGLLAENGDAATLAETWNMLGSVLDARGSGADALEAYRRSIGIWTSLGNAFETARVENNEAIIVGYRGELAKARTMYERILRYFQDTLNDRQRTAVTLTNLGRVDAIIGDYSKAAAGHQRAIALAQELNVPWIEANARINLAWVHLFSRRLQDAQQAGQRVIRLAREKQVVEAQPEAYRLLGAVSLARHDLPLAKKYAELARAQAQEQHGLPEEASAERLLGQVLNAQGATADALVHLERSVILWREIGDVFEIAQSQWQLALARRVSDDAQDAACLAAQALTEFAQLPSNGVLADIEAHGAVPFFFSVSPEQAMSGCWQEMSLQGWEHVDHVPWQDATGAWRARMRLADVDVHLIAAATTGGATVELTVQRRKMGGSDEAEQAEVSPIT